MPGAAFTDLDAFFDANEFATAATWQPRQLGAAAVPADVMLDAPAQILFDGVVSIEWSATYRVANWPTVSPGDRLTAGAVIFEVREVLNVDDGLLARATLKRLN